MLLPVLPTSPVTSNPRLDNELAHLRAWGLDLSEPTAQTFETSAADLLAKGVGNGLADNIYLFDDPDTTARDRVSGDDMLLGTSIRTSQNGVGIWTGTQFYRTRVMETAGGDLTANNRIEASNSSVMDPGGDSYGILLMFRAADPPPANRQLFSKDDGTVSIQAWLNSAGSLSFFVDDGTNNDTVAIVKNFGDGNWHCALFLIDRVADVMRMYTDMGNSGTKSIAAFGDVSPSSTFRLGDDTMDALSLCQYAYLAKWSGDAAAGMDDTDLDAFFTMYDDPTGRLTCSRGNPRQQLGPTLANLSPSIVGAPENKLSWGYDPGLDGLGLGIWDNYANGCTHAADFVGGWTFTDMNGTAYQESSPRGFREATHVQQSGASGDMKIQVTGLTPSTDYTYSIWVWNTETNQDALLEVYNAADTVLIDSNTETIPAQGVWNRVQVTFQPSGSETSVWIHYAPGEATSDKEAYVFGAMVVEGVTFQPNVYIHTSGTGALHFGDDVYMEGGEVVNTVQGELVWRAGARANKLVYYIDQGPSQSNRWIIYQSGTTVRLLPRDSTGTPLTEIFSSGWNRTIEFDVRVKWNSVAPIPDAVGYHEQIQRNDAIVNAGETSSWSAGDSDDRVTIGAKHGGDLYYDGIIQLVEYYSAPRP